MKPQQIIILTSLSSCLIFAAFLIGQYKAPQKKERGAAVFHWPEGMKAALSLTFDDARPSQIDTGMPILDKYRVKGTFYVSPDNLEKNLDGWRRAVKAGHEIGNHTMTHPCTGNYAFSRENALEDYTLDRMAREIDDATGFVQGKLEIRPRSFAYPCGQTFVGRGKDLKSYIPLVAERFLTGRGWLGEDANDPAFCDLAQLLAMESDGKLFEQLKPILDRAIDEGRWVIFCGHEIGKGGYQTTLTETVEKLCQYALDPANGIWLDTVSNIGDYVLKNQKNKSL
jgi:peptidoglycan/xylan/chitin deacetylase (PgdA/CDA1 family)